MRYYLNIQIITAKRRLDRKKNQYLCDEELDVGATEIIQGSPLENDNLNQDNSELPRFTCISTKHFGSSRMIIVI